MPIRFACPHCHQKLSISSRKAGQEADCPRCHRLLTIPAPPGEPEPQLQPTTSLAPASTPAALEYAVASGSGLNEPDPLPSPLPEGEGVAAQLTGVEPVFAPDDGDGFAGLELVYDSPTTRVPVAAPPVAADLIAVPRYAIYLQGGLLAVVAFVAFIIGLLAGGTMLSGPATPPVPQACLISGSVTYASGPRRLPDEGAVIAIIPQSSSRPDEKAPIDGLRPGDPSPDADHRGIAILRELGGGYTRADAAGRFELKLPDRGRYLVLVISHEKQVRSADEIQTADILKLGPYFANAADLLGDRRYQLTQETLRGDKQLQVAFP